MTEKTDIEKRLASAIDEMTPDILDDLMAELDVSTEPVPTMTEILRAEEPAVVSRRPRRRWTKAIASCAAVLALVIGGAAFLHNGNETFAVVGLDVNPSIELAINQDEKVVSVEAINEDGVEILSEMDLEGTDVDVACNALVGAMLTKGYLTDTANGLLVSVRAENVEKGKEIENRLSSSLNSYLENSEIAAAIVGQFVGDDERVMAFANENGISSGKAWLICSLMDTGDPNMQKDSLLQLSVHDLILLEQGKGFTENVSYGKADTSEYIGDSEALSIALAAAGVDSAQASGIEVEYECDDGMIVYEVEFFAGGQEYEYDINAKTGDIVSSENGDTSYDVDDDDYDDDDDEDDDDEDDDDDDDDD